MAEICPVCKQEITSENRKEYKGVPIHNYCLKAHIKQNMQERLKGQSLDSLMREEKERTVHVKSFDMPFGDMVGFIFKWVMASIPTAIFLAILFAIFTAIFT